MWCITPSGSSAYRSFTLWASPLLPSSWQLHWSQHWKLRLPVRASPPGRRQGVLQQHRDRHGPDTSGDGRDRARNVSDSVEVDVAVQAAVGSVHANVDHDGTGPD